jgi:hypothetical protein
MQIDFAAGEAGYREARDLRAMVRYLEQNTATGAFSPLLMERLMEACERHMGRPEFAELCAREPPLTDRRPWLLRLKTAWEALRGPSLREMELGHQRSDALERADRAERAGFDALSEAARNARERDLALSRVEALERQLADLTRRLGPG